MVRKLKGMAFTAVIVGLVYAGYIMGIETARNLAQFSLWLAFLLSLFSFNQNVRNSMRAKGRAVPAWTNTLAGVVVLSMLVASGEFVLGAAWLLTQIFHGTIYMDTK